MPGIAPENPRRNRIIELHEQGHRDREYAVAERSEMLKILSCISTVRSVHSQQGYYQRSAHETQKALCRGYQGATDRAAKYGPSALAKQLERELHLALRYRVLPSLRARTTC